MIRYGGSLVRRRRRHRLEMLRTAAVLAAYFEVSEADALAMLKRAQAAEVQPLQATGP